MATKRGSEKHIEQVLDQTMLSDWQFTYTAEPVETFQWTDGHSNHVHAEHDPVANLLTIQLSSDGMSLGVIEHRPATPLNSPEAVEIEVQSALDRNLTYDWQDDEN